MTPEDLGDRVHFIYHDYRHTISIYVVRNKKEKGCLPVVYLLDILLVLSVSILEPKYDCVQDMTVWSKQSVVLLSGKG